MSKINTQHTYPLCSQNSASLSQWIYRKRYEYSAWKSILKTKRGSDLTGGLHVSYSVVESKLKKCGLNYLEMPLTSILAVTE